MAVEYEFVLASLSDLDYLLELRKDTMVEHLLSSGVVYNDDQHKSRILDCFDCFHLIKRDGQLVGGIKFHVGIAKLDIMQLQISPKFQNQGIGGQVIKQILAQYPHLDCYLTVLKTNPAKGLYLRLGFEQYNQDELEYHLRLVR